MRYQSLIIQFNTGINTIRCNMRDRFIDNQDNYLSMVMRNYYLMIVCRIKGYIYLFKGLKKDG
jgi:hypothetical protein